MGAYRLTPKQKLRDSYIAGVAFRREAIETSVGDRDIAIRRQRKMGCSYREIGNLWGISVYHVKKITHQSKLPKWLRWLS